MKKGKGFTIIDISGDIGIQSSGISIAETFIHAALGMYSLITNLDIVERKKKISVVVKSTSLDGLLVTWLNELIFHFDAYGFIGKEIIMNEFLPKAGGLERARTFRMKASISGEEFNAEKHESKLLVKAATYHQLKIEKVHRRWVANVIFDI
jgi:SHS2 domain-containing protein